MATKHINIQQLETGLRSIDHAAMVSVVAITPARMRKRGNPFVRSARGDVFKLSLATGTVCWTYSSSVNKQRRREGKPKRSGQLIPFAAQPRSWGQRIPRTPLVCHVTAGDGITHHYLELKVQSRRDVFVWADFDQIAHADIGKWLTKSRPSSRQKVQRPVILRDFRLDHIAQFKHGGNTYVTKRDVASIVESRPYDWRPSVSQGIEVAA